MDTISCSAANGNSAHLDKRRRFVAAPESFRVPFNATPDQPLDNPLLFQFSGRLPSRHDIEAELLQVGMRIRKSVNDGYKTTAFTPRPFFNMNRLSPATQAALSGTLNRQPISTATFCGINLAALAHINSTPFEEPRTWTYSSNHKRGYNGDSDSDDQDFMPQTPVLIGGDETMTIPIDYFDINFDIDNDIDVSPTSLPTGPAATASRGRKLAKPKSRKHQQTSQQQQFSSANPFSQLETPFRANGVQWMGHKRMTSCGIEAKMSMNDFNEASFLQRREDVEMDYS